MITEAGNIVGSRSLLRVNFMWTNTVTASVPTFSDHVASSTVKRGGLDTQWFNLSEESNGMSAQTRPQLLGYAYLYIHGDWQLMTMWHDTTRGI